MIFAQAINNDATYLGYSYGSMIDERWFVLIALVVCLFVGYALGWVTTYTPDRPRPRLGRGFTWGFFLGSTLTFVIALTVYALLRYQMRP